MENEVLIENCQALNSSAVAIIIVNWNSFDVTAQCLESLRTVTYNNFTTVVVDNGSNDGSGKRLKSDYPEIVLLENEKNLGFTGGNNAGIQYALDNEYDYLMMLNNDAIATPDFLSVLMDRAQESGLKAIQPKIMYDYDRSVIWNASGKFNNFLSIPKTLGEGQKDNGQFDHLKFTDWITGCCFLVETELVKRFGLLDQRFFIYYEDTDWSLKIRDQGEKMGFEPKAVVYHEAGKSDNNRDKHGEGNVSPFAIYQGVRNHIFIVRRYAKGINWLGSWAFQIGKISAYLLYFLLRRRFVKLKHVWKGALDGLTQ